MWRSLLRNEIHWIPSWSPCKCIYENRMYNSISMIPFQISWDFLTHPECCGAWSLSMFRTTLDVQSSYSKILAWLVQEFRWSVIHIHQTRVEERPRKSDNVNQTRSKEPLTKVSKDGSCKSKVKLEQPTGGRCATKSWFLNSFSNIRNVANVQKASKTFNAHFCFRIKYLWITRYYLALSSWWQSLTGVLLPVRVTFSWFTNMTAGQGSCI